MLLPTLVKYAMQPPRLSTVAFSNAVPAAIDIDDVSLTLEQARTIVAFPNPVATDYSPLFGAKDMDMCLPWETVASIVMSDFSLPAMALIWAMTFYILFHYK